MLEFVACGVQCNRKTFSCTFSFENCKMLILQQGVTTEMLISLQKQGNVDFMRTCELKNVDFTSISVKHWFHKDKWLQRPLQNSKMLQNASFLRQQVSKETCFSLAASLIFLLCVGFTSTCNHKDVVSWFYFNFNLWPQRCWFHFKIVKWWFHKNVLAQKVDFTSKTVKC